MSLSAELGRVQLLAASCKHNINGAILKWSLSLHPRRTAYMSYTSNLGMLKTGQNNLWTGPRSTFCLKELFAKIRKQLTTRLMTIGLKINNIV